MSARAFVKRTAAVLLLAGTGLLASPTARADTTPTPPSRTALTARTPDAALFSSAQQKCEAGIANRIKTLNADVTRINDAKDLTSSDRSSLLSIANSDISELTALKSKVQSDTAAAQLGPDCKSVVSQFRIYVLFEPQVHLVITADRIEATVAKLQTLLGKVQTNVSKSYASADVKKQVTDTLNDISSKLQAAATAASGVPSQVLALNPGGYPGNAAILKTARASLETARTDLKGLRTDLKDLAKLLKGHKAARKASPQATATA